MSNPSLLKNMIAGAAINAFTLVKFSAADTVVTAAAATDSIIGVTNEVAPASGERCDIIVEGIAFITAGAAIALGALLTADASGRVVTVAPAAGTNNRIIGIAFEAAAAAGDVIRVLLTAGSYQG
jgi:hypothetical protein